MTLDSSIRSSNELTSQRAFSASRRSCSSLSPCLACRQTKLTVSEGHRPTLTGTIARAVEAMPRTEPEAAADSLRTELRHPEPYLRGALNEQRPRATVGGWGILLASLPTRRLKCWPKRLMSL